MDGDIRNWLREGEYITFLAKKRKEDPLPQGVVADNPFSSNPWDYPEDSWYFFEESFTGNNWEGGIGRTENGFWKWSNTVMIPTESVLGFRNVFEFYQGSTPEGTRTGWMMHCYHAGQNNEEACHAQDNSSLCRIFWNNIERVQSSQPNTSSAASIDIHTLDSDIIVREEEREDPSRKEADASVFINDCYDDFIEMRDLVSSDGETRELYDDLSDRSYIEFDDLLTSDSASTSSGNLSNINSNYGEYFNIDELLGEIARDAPVPMDDNEEKTDCFSCFTGPIQLVLAERDKQLKASMSPDKVNSKRWNNLSGGEYLEVRDLPPSSRATTSGNLGCKSSSPGDFYFNVDELLRNIARDCGPSVKEDQEKPDCGFCMDNYIHSESVASCIGNIGAGDENDQSRSLEGPSTSLCSRTGQVKQNRSEGVSNCSGSSGGSSGDSSDCNDNVSSSGGGDCNDTNSSGGGSTGGDSNGCNITSKTPQSRRRRSRKRLAKIGKFFCFP